MTYLLETERLGLRFLDDNDFDAVAQMLRDKRVMYAWEKTFSDPEIWDWIARRKRGYLENGFDYFIAIDKQSGKCVGQIGLLNEQLDGKTMFGLGWILNKDCWGKGYALEGAHALRDYAFRLLHLPELIADIRPTNIASIHVAEKLGMRAAETVVKMVDGKEMPHTLYKIKNPYLLHCTFQKPPDGCAYPQDIMDELSHMAQEDTLVRNKLAALQRLSDGYNPQMEGVHLKNSMRLEEIINTHGFPTLDKAGKEACDNAWLIVQHAIGRPAFMRAALAFFGTLNGHELPPSSFAYLTDRIAYYERRPQTYGTQFHYGLDGVFAPWWTHNESAVDVRRRAVGLPPIQEVYQRMRLEGAAAHIKVMDAFEMRVLEEHWLLTTGWCPLDELENFHNTYNN